MPNRTKPNHLATLLLSLPDNGWRVIEHAWPRFTIFDQLQWLEMMTDHDWSWLTIWPWLTMNDHDWPGVTITDHNWPWLTMNNHDWPGLFMTYPEWPWLTMIYHEWQYYGPDENVYNRLLNHGLRLGFQFYRADSWIRGPVQCFNCEKYGHIASVCRQNRCCVNCSGTHEADRNCGKEAKCANCSGNHRSSDRSCPARKTLFAQLISNDTR